MVGEWGLTSLSTISQLYHDGQLDGGGKPTSPISVGAVVKPPSNGWYWRTKGDITCICR